MLLTPCLKEFKDLPEKTEICKRADVAATSESTLLNANTGLVMPDEDDDEDWRNQQLTISQDEDECNNDDAIVGTAEGRQLTREKAQKSSSESMKKRKLKVGYHHGALNPLPQA